MKTIGKQSKEMTLKRIGGDEFKFFLEVGVYYIDGVEKGVFINTASSIIFFDNFDEYWNTDLDVEFWEKLLWHTNHELVSRAEATTLSHVVEELRKEVETGVNQIYINDETWIDGLFELVI